MLRDPSYSPGRHARARSSARRLIRRPDFIGRAQMTLRPTHALVAFWVKAARVWPILPPAFPRVSPHIRDLRRAAAPPW